MNTEHLNFHSHDPEAEVVTLSPEDYADYVPRPGQKVTVGIHPWATESEQTDNFELLARALSDPNVVAIGEIGIDPMRGADIERQSHIMRAQIKNAMNAGLPIVFHIVRRFDLLLAHHHQYEPHEPWAVHGFRGKPEVVKQLASAGIYMSVGKNFNEQSVKLIPDNLLLVETDGDPATTIEEVVEKVAEARGAQPEAIANLCRKNLCRFYSRL